MENGEEEERETERKRETNRGGKRKRESAADDDQEVEGGGAREERGIGVASFSIGMLFFPPLSLLSPCLSASNPNPYRPGASPTSWRPSCESL